MVFRDVPTSRPGGAIPLHGIFFSNARVSLLFYGSAVMAADGMVRLGLIVHASARHPSVTGGDVVYSGETDASFAGVSHVKTDGEVYPLPARGLRAGGLRDDRHPLIERRS